MQKMWATMFKIVYFLHVSGCFWYMCTSTKSDAALHNVDLDAPKEVNWVNSAGIDEDGMLKKYIWSIYWATVTCTTVGYGDITPTNNYELAWVMVIIVGGVMMFSYFLGDLSSAFVELLSESNKFKYQLDSIDQMITKFDLDFFVAEKMKMFFEN